MAINWLNELHSSAVGNFRLSKMGYRVLYKTAALKVVRLTVIFSAISDGGGDCL